MDELAAAITEDQVNGQSESTTVNSSDNQAPKPEGPDLNIQDLIGLKSIIDIATQRGAFKANELEGVGRLYNRLNMFLEAVTKQKEQ